jgi:acetyl esterase
MSFRSLLEPGASAYMEKLRCEDGKPLSQLSIAEARQSMRDVQTTPIHDPSVSIDTRTVDGLTLHIVRPNHATQPLPAILYFHGGGWVLGGLDTHARIVRELAISVGAAVVFPEYTLSPEVCFPVAVEQCYAATRWVAEQGSKASIDTSRIAVVGDSAGGNLAAVVALLASERNGPSLCLQALLCPVTDCDFASASYDIFANDLNLSRESMQWFWSHYVPEVKLREQPLVSPLRANIETLSKLPPALVITAECDVLRDEGESYAHKLAQAGVSVTAMRLTGTVHNFMVIDELQHSFPARSAMQSLIERLQLALHSCNDRRTDKAEI